MTKKRILFVLICMAMLISSLVSCNLGGSSGGDKEKEEEKVDNLIFNSQTKTQIIKGEDVSKEVEQYLFDSLYEILVNTPEVKDDSAEALEHEIILCQ